MTDKAGARKTVLVAMVMLLGIAAYRANKPEQDVGLFKRVWGVTVLGAMLSLLADFVPQIAGPFAALTVLGSLTSGGDKALQNLLAGLSGSAATVTPAATAATARPSPQSLGLLGPQGASTVQAQGAPPGVTGPQTGGKP